ncbi:type II secretion system F family protein [bacterium]|nr:type II secretion system F family protein [bacterium]
MPIFEYKAIDAKGKEVRGQIEADDIESATNNVRTSGLYITNMWPLKKDIKSNLNNAFKRFKIEFSMFFSGSVKDRDFTAFTRQLATLLNAGLPLIRSLNILHEQQKPGLFKKVLRSIADDVEAGNSFSDALSRFPKIFDNLFISMIRAGEVGGVLDTILGRLAEFREQNQVLKNKVKAASIYPIVVIVMACIVVGVLMVFVIPKFKDIFKELGASLPVPTVILLTASTFVQYYWWVFFILVFVCSFIYKLLKKIRTIAIIIDKIKLKIPIIGELIKKINITRFARTFGTLISSGVPILQSLDIVGGVSTNYRFAKAVRDVHNSIREGESISVPLGESKVFPPVVVNMIDVGEETGSLDDMLMRIADIYDSEVDFMITSITKLLEPMLIVLMAFIVGYIVISMFLPLISLMSALGG